MQGFFDGTWSLEWKPFWSDLASWAVTDGLAIVLIIISSLLVFRVTGIMVDHLFATLARNTRISDATRFAQRTATLASVLKNGIKIVVGMIAVIMILDHLGQPITPLVASVGVVGLALSFGAQNLVRDIIGGFVILLEDQYGVGDVVSINKDYAGVVEGVTLRVTRLRNLEGHLITIPNGSIQVVANMSKEWSRVVLDIPVSYSQDLGKAFEVIKTAAHTLWQERPDNITSEPELLGVDQFADSAVIIRLLVKTQPGKQWEIGREMRRRLKETFDREGIGIPFPQLDIWMHSTKPQTADPEQSNTSASGPVFQSQWPND